MGERSGSPGYHRRSWPEPSVGAAEPVRFVIENNLVLIFPIWCLPNACKSHVNLLTEKKQNKRDGSDEPFLL